MRSGKTKAFDLLRAMRDFLGDNDMMAYLAMMAVRLLELHRVLKPTGTSGWVAVAFRPKRELREIPWFLHRGWSAS